MTQDNSERVIADDDRLTGPLAAAVRGICDAPAPHDVETRVLASAAGWKRPAVRRGNRGPGLLALATAVSAVVAAGILLVALPFAPAPARLEQTVVQSLPRPESSDFSYSPAPAASQDGADSILLGMQPPVVTPGATPGASDGIEPAAAGYGLGFGARASGATPGGSDGVAPPASGFGGGQRGLGGIAMAGATVNPAPLYAIAAEAPVIVSLGGAQPMRLGGEWQDDGTRLLHVWDWSRSDMSRSLGAEQHGNPAAVSPDGKWIITFEGRKIDTATGAVESIEPPFGDWLARPRVGPGSARAVEGIDPPSGAAVQKIRFSPDGRTLLLWVVAPDYKAWVRLLDFPSCAPRVEVPDVFGYMFAVDFTADGNELVLMDKEMYIRRWDALTGVELQKFETPHTNSIRALAISPDGRWVASAGPEGEIFLHDAHTGALRHRLNAKPKIGPEMVYSLQFSPDGRRLAGGGIDEVFLWDCESGEEQRKFPASPRHIRFSEDGRRITTVSDSYGSRDETGHDTWGYPAVQHWDVATGEEMSAAAAEDRISLDRLITGFDELAVIDPNVHVLVGVTSTQALLDKVVGTVRTLPAGEVSAGVFVSGNPAAGVSIVFDDTETGRQAKERVVRVLSAADISIKEQFAKGARSRMYYGAVPGDYAIAPQAASSP